MDALLVENQYRSRTVINLHSADCKHSKIGSLEAGALHYPPPGSFKFQQMTLTKGHELFQLPTKIKLAYEFICMKYPGHGTMKNQV